MHLLISALLLAALTTGAPTGPEPNCRAKLEGRLLTTSIQFPSGYTLEAPWQVVQTQRAWVSEKEMRIVVDLALDRIVELDDLTGARNATQLPQPVHVQVVGTTEPEVVQDAAQTWCSSVIKARGLDAAPSSAPLAKAGRIT